VLPPIKTTPKSNHHGGFHLRSRRENPSQTHMSSKNNIITAPHHHPSRSKTTQHHTKTLPRRKHKRLTQNNYEG
jgi:hypothetical protein